MAFHVPESARIVDHPVLGSTRAAGNNGAFDLPSPEPGWRLLLVCSDSSEPESAAWERWEHVSVHAQNGRRQRTPTWKEMAHVKDLCWDEEDIVIQIHPKRSEYVNQHPHTLHLWRPVARAIPTPPSIFVGER